MIVNNIEIEIERKAIKNIHLAVYPPDGHVHVSSPQEFSDEYLKLYVMKKMAWIMEKRSALSSFERQTPRTYISGEAHYFKGILYRLKVIRDNRELQHVTIDGDYLLIYVRESAEPQHIEGVLYDWYREQLRPIVADFIQKWSSILSVSPNSWEIHLLTKEWGSCKKNTGNILINLQLAKKPLRCIEYVVAHEMVHLIERTHTDRFRMLLDRHLPGWKDIQKELNEFPL